MRSMGGQRSEGDNNQLRATTKADLTATREAAKEFSVYYSIVIWHLKQIGKVEKLNKWVSHELTTNQKHRLLLSHTKTTNRFSTGL